MSDLGPIGHLPVDHQRARDAAAGPRFTIPLYDQAKIRTPQPFGPWRDERPDHSWRTRAACRGVDPALFFPEQGGAHAPNAKAICATCPVQPQCLEDGMSERFGVWGGTSEHERIVLRRTRSTERARFDMSAPFAGLVLAVDAAMYERKEGAA